MTKKQKITGQILVLAVTLLLFVRPLAVKLNANLKAREQLVKQAAELSGKLEILNGIETGLADERVKKMEAVFPSIKPIVPLLASLSQLAAEHSLTFGGLSLSPGSLSQEKGQSDLKDLSFNFEVGGDFLRISQFMKSLENTAPLMKIESVSLNIKTNPLFDPGATQVTAQVEVSAYYQAPPKTLGSIDKPVRLLTKNEEGLLNQLIGFRTFPAILPTGAVGKEDLFEVQPRLP